MRSLRAFFSPQFTLMRSIDLSYPPHQQMLSLCFLAFFLAVSYWIVFLGLQAPVALIAATIFTVSLMLTWAMSRELLPEYEKLSLYILPVAAIIIWWSGFPSLVLMGAILLLLRAVNGICGKSLTIIDITLIITLFIWALQSMKVDMDVTYVDIASLLAFVVSYLLYTLTVSSRAQSDIHSQIISGKRVLIATGVSGCILALLAMFTDSARTELFVFVLILLSSIRILHTKRRFQS